MRVEWEHWVSENTIKSCDFDFLSAYIRKCYRNVYIFEVPVSLIGWGKKYYEVSDATGPYLRNLCDGVVVKETPRGTIERGYPHKISDGERYLNPEGVVVLGFKLLYISRDLQELPVIEFKF